MKTLEYTTIDRAAKGWPSGPWDGEPDKMQWPDHVTGLPCLAVRHPCAGHWCGYVGIQESHPYFGESYHDVNANVHGGLTFASACDPKETVSEGVCHIPDVGEADHVWWFGFDCAHYNDYSPQDVQLSLRGYPFGIGADEQYRTLAYVKEQCAGLASQLAAADAAIDDAQQGE